LLTDGYTSMLNQPRRTPVNHMAFGASDKQMLKFQREVMSIVLHRLPVYRQIQVMIKYYFVALIDVAVTIKPSHSSSINFPCANARHR